MTKSKLALMTETHASAVEVLASAPEVVDPKGAPTSTVSLLYVDAETRRETEHETARTIADYGFYGVKQSKARTEMFDSVLKLRRSFPAAQAVRDVLGDDAADLIGQTDEYKAAVALVWSEAQTILVTKLRREVGTETAKQVAEGVIAKLRSNLSNDLRKEMEITARGQKNPQLFLLGHGFARSTQLPKGQLIIEGAKLAIDEKTGEASVVLPRPKKAADGAPATATDQADKSAEQVAKDAALASDLLLTTPAARINLAVGEIRTAVADKRTADLPPAERIVLARLIGQVAFEALSAIGESLPEEEALQVAIMIRQMAHVSLTKVDPQGHTTPKPKVPATR